MRTTTRTGSRSTNVHHPPGNQTIGDLRPLLVHARPGRAGVVREVARDTPTSPRTIGTLWKAIGAPVPWEQLLVWPPDVFGLTDLLLVQADTYRFVSSPPAGAVWPPNDRWAESVRAAGKEWSEAAALGGTHRPGVVPDCWEALTKAREVPLDVLSRGEQWHVCEAIITLHAAADEACSSLYAFDAERRSAFANRAWATLRDRGSLSRFPPSQVRVLPKTHVPAVGNTIRSMARYLSAHTSPVDVKWRRGLGRPAARSADADTFFPILLLPWPLTVEARDFRPTNGPLHTKGDPFGFFAFAPHLPLDLDYVRGALRAAARAGGAAMVILPESSVAERELPSLERTMRDFDVIVLGAGVRGEVDPRTGVGRNYAHIGIWTGERWLRYEQDKHHRWLLDARQIDQYRLESSLDPRRRWCEAIAVPPQSLQIFDRGAGTATAVVICEDLARADDMAEAIRGIGPTTMFALLLDGPQIASRWSSRYASVLADDPGSTVIALTCLGMAVRSRPAGTTPSRSIALWKDAERGLKEIELRPDADAVLLITSETAETAWTADGRRHTEGTPRLVLEEVRQLHAAGERVIS